jgi:hypothetical protein
VTAPRSINQLLREAAGRRDPEPVQQPVERYGSAGIGRGGAAPWWPQRRDPHQAINEQLRLALAAKRGLIQTNDFFP